MKTCLCSVLVPACHGDYRLLFLTMLKSLRINSGIDPQMEYIIFGYNLDQETKDKIMALWPGVAFKEIPIEKYTKMQNPKYYSIEAFSLCEYDRVIFLDIDLLCLKNAMNLLNIETPQNIGMVHELRRGQFNAGVIIINKPNNELYNALLTCNPPHEIFGHDQKIYNYYFKAIDALPHPYNTLITEVENINEVIFLHFIHKPFHSQCPSEYSQIWKKYEDMTI